MIHLSILVLLVFFQAHRQLSDLDLSGASTVFGRFTKVENILAVYAVCPLPADLYSFCVMCSRKVLLAR